MSDLAASDNLAAGIRKRYEHVMEQVAQAASRSGHEPARVVVVSKSQPLGVVKAAISAGITLLGENYVEEAVEKVAALQGSTVEWHMIGHIQSRKAEPVATHFAMVHSVDDLKLARRLDRFCGEQKHALPILLEVNVSGEESKFGFPAWEEGRWNALLPDLEQIAALPNLKVSGLMTMPPYSPDAEAARPFFQRMRRLRDYLRAHLPQASWTELSMGTSVDFPVAIQEGATFVRIGEAILGPRPAKRES